MAVKKFNIPALYEQVFGITGVRFAIPTALNVARTEAEAAAFASAQRLSAAQNVTPKQRGQYDGIQTIPEPVAYAQSVLGTPIYEQITLTVPPTVTNGISCNNGKVYTFPDWPLFDINPAWIIKKENTTNGSSSVKEFITQDDFMITIRGFLINYASQDYPEDLLNDFWSVINSQKSMGITSRVFNLLNIHNIVVMDARLPGVEGYMNMQPFEVDCVSDVPAELIIKAVATQRAIVQGL